jgi:DNA-binding response OmpR family regulator
MSTPKAHILVVDDEPVARQSLTDILRLEGYRVESVPNGESAVDYVRMYSVDLMVLDLRMPGMGGLDVIQVLGQLSPETEVILLTAYGSMESAVEALRHRVHDYLLKPASPTQIVESVKRGLARRKAKLEAKKNARNATLGVEDVVMQNGIFQFPDGTQVDLERRLVRKGNVENFLTPAEGHLLKVFLENPGQVYTHRDLVLLVQGYDVSQREAQEILRPLVSRLRHKISDFPELFDRIVSVRGTGYIFEVAPAIQD